VPEIEAARGGIALELGRAEAKMGDDFQPVEVPARDVGRIRSATRGDTDALARLFLTVGLDALPDGVVDVAACLDRGILLVLDVGAGGLGAAAHVELDCIDDNEAHARIQFFVIHPGLAKTGTEERLVAAVLAVCEASGCVDIDVGARRQPIRG